MIIISIIFITALGTCSAGSVNEKYHKLTDVISPTTSNTTNCKTATACCRLCSTTTSCKLVRYDVTNQTCEESTSRLLLSASTLEPLNVYVKDSNKVYELVRTYKTWNDAMNYCADRGGQLVKIDSAEKQGLLQTWFDEYGESHHQWIGLSMLANNGWRWTDGSVLNGYDNWGTGKPDNAGGNQYCAYWNGTVWNDFRCNGNAWSFCEYG